MPFFFSLIGTSIRASLSLRLAFFVELILMIGNNLIFFLIWWIFFNKFKRVGGWVFDDLVVMMAIVRGGYGLARVFFGGTKTLARTITGGGLDPFMTQPKNLLLYLLGSKSQSKGWGHIVSAIILYVLIDITRVQTILMLLGIICSCLIFTSVSVIAHSMCFWFGNVGEVSKKYVDSIFLFVHYPVNIYSGLLQVFMFTLFPAGLIGYLPVELLKSFSWTMCLSLIGATVIFIALAFATFYSGLRRYESGNLFTSH